MGEAPDIFAAELGEGAGRANSPGRMPVATRPDIPGEVLSSRARFRFSGCR